MPKRLARLQSALPPSQPPSGADMSALVKRVNELSLKVLNKSLAKGALEGLPRWKRWVGGEAEYDIVGLRDRLATLTTCANQIKSLDVDQMKQEIIDLKIAVAALQEAPAPRPFP